MSIEEDKISYVKKACIEKDISLPADVICENYKEKILLKLKYKLEFKCEKSIGYVVKIFDDIEIISNSISPANNDIFFKVKANILFIKPEVGNEYDLIVTSIGEYGLSGSVQSNDLSSPTTKIEIFVSKDDIKGAVYNQELKSFIYNETGSKKQEKREKKISVSNLIKVKITHVNFAENFKCIGVITSLS